MNSGAASAAYKNVGEQEKETLRDKAERQFSDVTKVDVRRKAASVFKTIQNQVCL